MNRKKNPKMKQFNVRLTADELETLRRVAWDRNQSISNFVYQLIAPFVVPSISVGEK